MKASRSCNLLILIMVLLNGIASAQPGSYYPPPSEVNNQNDTLSIFPPDSLPGGSAVLLFYNIYVDDEFFGNVDVADPEVITKYFLDDETVLPGSRIFCVTAVYNEWISESTCDTATILYGYELPFLEDWSSGSFETLQWTTDSDHWVINSEDGNPAPSATFLGEPELTDYEAVMESYPINATGMTVGRIWLDFDLKLDVTSSFGNEMLKVEVWNSSNQIWQTVAEFISWEGSFTWDELHISIKAYALNKVFRIRFLAQGVNASDIKGWYVDNIHVYRNCERPTNLEIEENLQYNGLTWIGNDWFNPSEWLHWDDGVYSGTSIGTGGAVEFDVAARWTAEQVSAIYGQPFTLDEIYFFPAESQATYNVRVWTGSGPDTLIVDQGVEYPVIGAWNYVSLDNPIVIDTSEDLWIGYHISTLTGYPAGVDDGPAINGYGNMINFEGAWSTLLEINSELDYNWNILGHVSINPYQPEETFYIYRETNQEGYVFYDISDQWEYIDSNIVLSDYYCYKVTEIWVEDGDTCESAPTNTACEVLMLGTGQQDNKGNILIYPNPADDFLNIESPEKIDEVRIYNMLGQCELKLEIGNWEARIDVSRLQSGIYFVEVVTGNKNFMSKVLIIR